jgi:hypothetical protein
MSTSGIARNDGSQNVHFIGKDVTYNTVGIGTADTVKVGRPRLALMLMPASSRHHRIQCRNHERPDGRHERRQRHGHRCGGRIERGRHRE